MPANEIKSISSIVVNRAIASVKYQTELKEILKKNSDTEKVKEEFSKLCARLEKENPELVNAAASKLGIILRGAGAKKEILSEIPEKIKEKILAGWDASEEKEEYIQ
ncbi:MAG TPA: hypothetical protein VI933_03775 [archaeon]|nr:hypothetical protein [archaeon]